MSEDLGPLQTYNAAVRLYTALANNNPDCFDVLNWNWHAGYIFLVERSLIHAL